MALSILRIIIHPVGGRRRYRSRATSDGPGDVCFVIFLAALRHFPGEYLEGLMVSIRPR